MPAIAGLASCGRVLSDLLRTGLVLSGVLLTPMVNRLHAQNRYAQPTSSQYQHPAVVGPSTSNQHPGSESYRFPPAVAGQVSPAAIPNTALPHQPRAISSLTPPPTARQVLQSYPAAIQQALNSANQNGIGEAGFSPIAYLHAYPQDLLSGGATGDLLDSAADDSVLNSMGPAAGGNRTGANTPANQIPGAGHGTDAASREGVPDGVDPHAEVFAEGCYPSAMTCAKCHKKIYDEWRVSAHAYAAVSPMFHKFEQAITQLSTGTVGTFCMRCHAPVAMQMNFPRDGSVLDAPQVIREGVTCVACHRVIEAYGRVHGERRIEPGPLQAPVYGSIGGDGVAKAIAEKDDYKIKIDPNDKSPGQEIHLQAFRFEQLSSSGFCQACHQVAVHPGIALEVVWAQYRASPACKKGISCQDCHMGRVPGKAQGYTVGAAAEMSGKSVSQDRKHSNHIFYGPGNSIAHPGIFPHNEKALRWNTDQWLSFDWRAGWGTKEFEKALADKQIQVQFPKFWDSADERMDARKVLDENFELLGIKRASAISVMEAGSQIEGPFYATRPTLGQDLKLHFNVKNASEGHNNPSGSLGAQPQLWLNVVLTGPNGQWLWESGYLDGNGDLANQHSLQVTQGVIPPDTQLFNLQTQFITTGVKGPDREMYLPVNVDIDQLPFLRPGNIPVSVLNHPPFIRMEQKSIPPLGMKKARYEIPGNLLCQPGTYRISVRMRSRMEPIYFMRFCNATPEMERRMLEQTIDLHPYAVEFNIPSYR
ncbi:MAG: hypothetical protein KDB22_23775 [Planctomycetales bacterium]|nr:hypothetical protein [Planctomycetales bacterium]